MLHVVNDSDARDLAIPRLAFDDLEPELAAALRPRVERLGYLGEFFRVTAWQPKALLDFYRLTEDLKDALPPNLTEAVALTVAAAAGNAYERHQHERLARKLGFSERWIAELTAASPDDARELSAQERITAAFALAVLRAFGRASAPERDALVAALGPKEAVAVMLLVGRYVMHALIVNTLELEPPVASIFAETVS